MKCSAFMLASAWSEQSAGSALLFLGLPVVLAVALAILFFNRNRLANSDRMERWREFARGSRFKIAMSVVACATASAIFVPVLRANSDLIGKGRELAAVILKIDMNSDQSAAMELATQGTVTIDGKAYGGAHVTRQLTRYYDPAGKLVDPIGLLEQLIRNERPAWIPTFLLEQPETTWVLFALTLGWMLLVVWMDLLGALILTLAATAVPALPLYWFGDESMMLAVLGMGLLTFTFAVLMRLVLALLNRPWQICAVAHTVVKESMRLRISVACIVVLLLVLPLIPMMIDDKAALRYQVQTFLSRSMTFTYAVAACMTLLLSCATVAFEIRDRQIWQLVTKPLGRLNYLVGKWLGVACVNLVLFLICGISIFTFVQYLRGRSAADEEDAWAVAEQVLTARDGAYPEVKRLERDQLIAQVNEHIQNDLVLRDAIDAGEMEESEVQKEIALRLQKDYMLSQRTVPPGLPPSDGRTYEFRNLGRAKTLNGPLTFRYVFHIGGEDQHEQHHVIFKFEATGQHVARTYVPTVPSVVYLAPDVIDDKGVMRLTIFNAGTTDGKEVFPGSLPLNFDDRDMQVMYRVSTFESNFVRAILVNWLKLSFLAMVGVSLATFLSFSVAALSSFTILLVSSMAGFLKESLDLYDVPMMSRPDQVFILYFGKAMVFFFEPIGRLSPISALVEGKNIAWGSLGNAVLLLGVVWCGVSLAVGYLVFRRRELATYSGHG